MDISRSMYILIAVLSMLNFARLLIMVVGSDIYDFKRMRRAYLQRQKRRSYAPLISIIIPAYNEETGVIRTVESVLANDYRKKQIIVVDDGSKDCTLGRLRQFQRKHPGVITVVHQANAGKAAAINRAVQYWAKGSLVMVVDADSLLKSDAVTRMVAHFRDRRILAAASNVKIIPTRHLLGIAQQFEYLISYRMKRALTLNNMEYIVGGVGSTFRRSALMRAGLYDTDTMTEDIDLTVKLIREYGNTYHKIHYAADSVAYTEHVMSFSSLIRQRFRWKYGRMQTLMKNRTLFFRNSAKYDKRLTWYQLPYALVGEAVLLVEPLLVGYILFVVVRYADLTSMISVYVIVSAFVYAMVSSESTETWHSKLRLTLMLPLVYFLMYILTAVEFAALIQSLRRAPGLLKPMQESSAWEHVERQGGTVAIN